MLVYGDRERRETGAEALAGIRDALARAEALPSGIERHGELVSAFIRAGELLQGIADREREALGCDAPSPAQDACTLLLTALARAMLDSWENGFAAALPWGALPAVEALDLSAHLAIRSPEGYAFYALYPEGYAAAARRLGIGEPVRVVGVRSIGTGLAAVAAAALGAPLPLTVRPGGHPFRREIRVSEAWRARALDSPDATFVVADEGPGLSGSSFGAVADWLEAQGVARERIAFLPSHPGDLGPQASEEHRARWRSARRACASFAETAGLDAAPGRGVGDWLRQAAGDPEASVRDISGGAWREIVYPDEARWPASDVSQERLKFLGNGRGGPALARFAGLGEVGHEKLALARALHGAGFCPEPLGLRHGFLLERWMQRATPLDLAENLDRAALVRRFADYVAFRARAFPARAEAGASPGMLLAMAHHNITEALGEEAAQTLGRFEAGLPGISAGWRACAGDNRMLPQDWLRLPDGRLLKADALDHHAAHDLVGAQDPAWDLAGAAEEFLLSADEADELFARTETALRRRFPPDTRAFARIAYLAFRVGACRMAATGLSWPEERARLEEAEERYAGALRMRVEEV